MFRSLILGLVGIAALCSPISCDWTDTGKLLVINASDNQIGIFVDPPERWTFWTAPYTAAQRAEFAKYATTINSRGEHLERLGLGKYHMLIAVNLSTLQVKKIYFGIAKKLTTTVIVEFGSDYPY